MTNAPTRPPVGNFRSAPGNSARKDPPAETQKPSAPVFVPAKAPPPAPPPVAADEPDAPEESKPDVDEAPLTPREAYEKRLEAAGISREVANSIFDAVMSKDYYEEYIRVGENRAVLRTRMYEDHLRLQTALELQRPGLVLSQEDMITRYNLAASLYEWRGKVLKHDNDDDFDKVLNIIKRMPAPVYSLLSQKLAEFDRKVMTVFSDGATDSF